MSNSNIQLGFMGFSITIDNSRIERINVNDSFDVCINSADSIYDEIDASISTSTNNMSDDSGNIRIGIHICWRIITSSILVMYFVNVLCL